MSGSLLILTGPPGAGKSTLARLVTKDAPQPTVHLHTRLDPDRVRGAVPA
ncbi:zeta toxin family protein [Amycolatopsis sp. NPDC048633]